jgi:hypothetical protein
MLAPLVYIAVLMLTGFVNIVKHAYVVYRGHPFLSTDRPYL